MYNYIRNYFSPFQISDTSYGVQWKVKPGKTLPTKETILELVSDIDYNRIGPNPGDQIFHVWGANRNQFDIINDAMSDSCVPYEFTVLTKHNTNNFIPLLSEGKTNQIKESVNVNIYKTRNSKYEEECCSFRVYGKVIDTQQRLCWIADSNGYTSRFKIYKPTSTQMSCESVAEYGQYGKLGFEIFAK